MSAAPSEPSPLVGVPACMKKILDFFDIHSAGDTYMAALVETAGVRPLIIPALGAAMDPPRLVGRLDGLLLTGSPSNVEPHHYAGAAADPDTLHDPRRDATTLPLIRAAVEAGLPVLAICRGLQELNVALGGSLHGKVHEVPGLSDHRSDKTLPMAERWRPAHEVLLTPGGRLAALNGGAPTARVNSLHGQGLDRLAAGLVVEARAPDGLVEAVALDDPHRFVVGVQWHPERWHRDDALSAALFVAFGAAARDVARRRSAGFPLAMAAE